MKKFHNGPPLVAKNKLAVSYVIRHMNAKFTVNNTPGFFWNLYYQGNRADCFIDKCNFNHSYDSFTRHTSLTIRLKLDLIDTCKEKHCNSFLNALNDNKIPIDEVYDSVNELQHKPI
jgi:hypothetical protein